MSGLDGSNWHNVHGGGLSFRPPTVDEALPYSPFTSVVPFSPDVLPYPVAEPPTPPTTLSTDQRTAARKAVGILNEEIKGPSSTAQHLEETFRELRSLLGNPREMTQFRFKPASQLATPPDSPNDSANATTPTKKPSLSPFASLLLGQADVDYLPKASSSVQRPTVNLDPSQRASPQVATQTPLQPVSSTPNRASHLQNGVHPYPTSTPASSASSQPPRSGPAVVIKPLGPGARREEYQRYDHMPTGKGATQQKRDNRREQESMLATLRPQEREVAEQKIEKLRDFAKKLCDDKEDTDDSEYFKKVSCLDSDLIVMRTHTLDRLYDRIMVVKATGCFSSVSVDTILRIHSLCEPSVTALDQSSLFSLGDWESWPNDLRIADTGLKAAKLALTAMLEGCKDRKVTPEDLIIAIIEGLKRVLTSCIFPVLESRRTGEMCELFACASGLKERLRSTILTCTGVLKGLAPLIGKVALTHNAVNPIEYIALALVIQQNSDSDKDSIFGIQKFESLRQAAMDVLTQVFAAHPDHQHSITSEILNNLEKLPDKGANARQFKSIRDPPIMSVSALFMRFVQVAATNQHNQHKKTTAPPEEDESTDEEESDSGSDEPHAKRKKKSKAMSDSAARTIAQRLTSSAIAIAGTIARVLTDRAMNVSKSGDKPFRNLLDMFVEDFCNVLGSPEWPAATVLLQQLLRCMIGILQSDRDRNKDMALTIMGSMGCGIIDFKLRVKRLKRELDVSQSTLSSKLDQLAENALDGGIHKKDLLSFKGPYRMVIESLPDYLNVEANHADPHLLSVRGCYMSYWLDAVTKTLQAKNDDAPNDQIMSDLQGQLEKMYADPNSLSREYKFQTVSEMHSRLAAGIITLQDAFCQYFATLVNTMIHHTRENAATLKSRAIKNIESFLDKDAQAIPQQLVMGVINLLRDNSPLVRADAISLVSKCLEGNPALEKHCISGILSLTTDPSNGPKKKAINLLKKIYQSSSSSDHKLNIVASLLLPSQDHEKTIADMSRQALEDIWLQVPATDVRADDNKVKFCRVERASLLVQTVRCIQGQQAHLEAFEAFFVAALASQCPTMAANMKICKDLVADMVEGVISPESMAAGCSQEHVLQALGIFARVSPGLFSVNQLQLLKLYVKDPSTTDDLNILRPTVTIFRFVLPHLPNLQADFADEVWLLLSRVISKLASWAARGHPAGKSTLQDVVLCSWMISPLTKLGVPKTIQVVTSTLVQLQPFSSATPNDLAKSRGRIISFLILLGTYGKICNFDSDHADTFRANIAKLARTAVDTGKTPAERLQGFLKPGKTAPSLLLLETVRAFTKTSWELSFRDFALCSVVEICQGSPNLFSRKDVEATFKVVFDSDIESLEQTTLTQFYEFFMRAERPSDGDSPENENQKAAEGKPRLGITFVAGEDQVMTNYLARQFWDDFVHVALKKEGELALIATKIITSVNRQGLVHPKVSGTTLIALGTSPNAQIAQMASIEHKKIHDAHESMFEKEYMAAIRTAFDFQRDVYEDTHGMLASTHKPKLIQVFNVLKGGSRKTLKKFIENFCKQINFNLSKLEDPKTGSDTVLYVRFCLENLALFDVPKMEDVASVTNALESIVMKLTGPSVGVAIETEMPKVGTPEPQTQEQLPGFVMKEGHAPPSPPPLQEPQEGLPEVRLLQLTRASIILQMMWETRGFVRRAYNLQNTTGRILHKDYQKPASRNNLISGKDLWERLDLIYNSTASRNAMTKRCYEFAELLEVDNEAQFGDEDGEGEDAEGYITPDDEAGSAHAVPTSGRGRKRKTSASLANTPKKPRGRAPGAKGKKRNSKTPDLEGWD